MRLHKDAKRTLIRSLPLFAGCTATEVAQVAAIADEIDLAEGKVLAAEHAVGREFLVIVEGSAQVERDGSVVATLGAGDFLGEIALVTGRRRVASVTATTSVRALVIEGRAFLHLLESAPAIRTKVERAVVERLTIAS